MHLHRCCYGKNRGFDTFIPQQMEMQVYTIVRLLKQEISKKKKWLRSCMTQDNPHSIREKLMKKSTHSMLTKWRFKHLPSQFLNKRDTPYSSRKSILNKPTFNICINKSYNGNAAATSDEHILQNKTFATLGFLSKD